MEEEAKDDQTTPPPVPIAGTCGCCGNTAAAMRCPCKEAFYCNSQCQRKEWPEHKDECIAHLKGKLDSYRTCHDAGCIRYTRLTFQLANSLVRKGRLEEAEHQLAILLAITKSVNGSQCDFYTQIVNMLGDILRKQHKHRDALNVYKQACVRSDQEGDWETKVEYVKNLMRITCCYDNLDEAEEGDKCIQTALQVVYNFPPDNPPLIRDIIISLAELSFGYGNIPRYEQLKMEAENYSQEKKLQVHNLKENVYTIIDIQSLYYTGKNAECIRRCNEIIPIIEKDPYYKNELAGVYFMLGQALAKNLDFKKAIENMHRAQSLFKKTVGKNHYNTAKCTELIGCMLANMGDYRGALNRFKASTNIYRRNPDTTPEDLLNNLTMLAKAHIKMGHKEQARTVANEALARKGVKYDASNKEEHMQEVLKLLFPDHEVAAAKEQLRRMVQ